jgi:outer membrane autotransporter protein
MGDGCGAFSANATEGSGSISGCVSQGNTWAEITGAWSGDDSYTLGTFGAHSFINPNLLIGGMLQFDYAEDSANNASGTGWMVGPYFVAQVPDQPLFFEGRLLYGQTDNDISPLGTYTDSFETDRWLAQLRATGEYQYQATTLMPLLDFTYTDDSQKAYTDSLGNTIPGQTVSLMQLTAGMDFSTPIPVSTGALELTGGLSGIYSASDGAAASTEFENWRGRTHLGLNYDMGTGATMNAGAFYDGIGTDYESYGATVGFDVKF